MTTKTKSKPSVPTTTALVRRIGLHPKSDKPGKLRTWQKRSFTDLVAATLAILNAPTGSGKSMVQKALAYTWAKDGAKVLIAVPECSIGKSFQTMGQVYALPNGPMLWEVDKSHYLVRGGVEAIVAKVIKFLKARPGATIRKRILVCTHQSLVLAHQRLIASGETRYLKGTCLLIDEAHRGQLDADEVASKADRIQCNRLGQLVHHYLREAPGRLLLTTATWLRGDSDSIVPKKDLGKFTRSELAFDEYLDGMKHLKEVEFKISFEDYATVVKKETKPGLKTIVHFQPVTKGRVNDKYKQVRDIHRVLGKSHTQGFLRVHESGLRSVDLVTEEGRGGATGRMTGWLKDEESQNQADVLLVQNMMQLGMNWPKAEQSFVFGFRKSLPMIIQMLGRILRDEPGKKKACFHLVMPKLVEMTTDQADTYFHAILNIMVMGWQCTLADPKTRKLRTQSISEVLRETLVHNVLTEAYQDKTQDEALEATLTDVVTRLYPELAASAEGKASIKIEAAKFSQAITDTTRALLKRMDLHGVKVPKGFSEIDRVFSLKIGAKQLKAIREQHAGLPAVTVPYIDQLIFIDRCLWHKQHRKYVDPRKIGGAVKLFGSAEALEKACRENGLLPKGAQ